jgi:hypothetical protein
MENAPRQEQPTKSPSDFSEYNQPEAPTVEQPAESSTDNPFDFGKYNTPEEETNRPVDASAEAPADGVFDFGKYQNGQELPKTFEQVGAEISEEAQLTKRFDLSDANIAAGGPVLRDATPAEIAEQRERDQVAEQLAARKDTLARRIAAKLLRRG